MPMIFKGVNEKEYPVDQVSTHQRLLVGAALRTTGPILELGAGYYSTPILHEVATAQKRRLLTVDNHEHWLENFAARDWKKANSRYGLDSPYHSLALIGWWGELPGMISQFLESQDRFGLAFIDQGPESAREYTIRDLLAMKDRQPDVFVMHDTEELFAYGYGRTLKMFRYQWTDKTHKAWTTIASNSVFVTQWFRMLPPIIDGETGEPT